jgi:hypothetical protein
MLRAPKNWYGFLTIESPGEEKDDESETVTAKASRKAWARMLAKVYEKVLKCPQCGSRMQVIAVILDSESIYKIISFLKARGRYPPHAQQTSISPASSS